MPDNSTDPSNIKAFPTRMRAEPHMSEHSSDVHSATARDPLKDEWTPWKVRPEYHWDSRRSQG